MATNDKPQTVHGGCLCEAVRYTINFPPDHDFIKAVRSICLPACLSILPCPLGLSNKDKTNSVGHSQPHLQCSTCQCSQCRKQTGSLIFRVQKIPVSALTWDAQSTLGRYRASEGCARGFCSACGSFLFWQNESSGRISMTVGCFDKEDLRRYGKVLTYAERHLWCDAEIEGVTDHLPGDKYKFDDEDGEVVLLSKK
ncbi:ribonuclease P complex subunit Pop1 [Purpureocillium lilacinum]|uniref:Ribonuclease P complex subunit Pop1 n=1 Tax=Purpureocillium lilacinum TaxID=33203 RepID=A0A2U3E992_PURLI|nr:hypothetical protein Purlil1_7300 [Purpureocillium lilacinum]PWI71070.1 ribonuclease P complex subunit Pop1 [Purpureocillium lilacinum]